MLDVLIVAPHPDDAEMAMAGAILKMKDEGLSVGVLDLTNGEPTPFGSPQIRARETAASSEVLGLEWRENLGLPNRSLEPTMEARAKLATVFRQTRPRWLFAPYWLDAHPDHVAATKLIEDARFWSKLTKTDMPGKPHHPQRIYYFFAFHLRQIHQPSFILDITPYWDKKQAAIECYHSQFVEGRQQDVQRPVDRFRNQAAIWGWSIGTQYGEAFASREPIGLSGLTGLL